MENGDGEGVKERSMDVALRDGGLVAQIVQCLDCDMDRHAAALVCRVWNEAVAWGAHKLVLRCRTSLAQLAQRFWHITDLDLSQCTNQLEDQDLRVAAAAFPRPRALRIGHTDQAQRSLTEAGVAAFAERCVDLNRVQLSSLPLLRDAGVAVLVTKLRALQLESCRSLGDEALEAIAECRELEELSLKGEFRFTSAGLAVVGSKCGGLATLALHLGAVNIDLILKAVASGCHKLRNVSLKFKAAKMRALSRCTTLYSLVFESDEEDRLDEAVVAIAAANGNLAELTCGNRLSDSAVIALILACPRLQKLHLDASNVTEGVLPCIQRCKFLTDLSLNHFQSTGQGLAEIGLCGLDFRKFSLSHARGVRDMELQMLMDGNGQLEHLDLQGCSGPTAIGYSAIALCANLRFLDLSFTTIDDLSLISIASGVSKLEQLTIVKCEAITNMSAVARFTQLESLILDHSSFVTDEGLDVLSRKCSRLTHLSLAFTRVTDTGLDYVSKCPMLRSLRIPYCKGVQGTGVVTIAKACGWFHHVVMSHRFRGSRTAETLRQLCCTVRFEMDEMALVPFDANVNYF
jgi:F-box/leucine-rich repeat protein 2/20